MRQKGQTHLISLCEMKLDNVLSLSSSSKEILLRMALMLWSSFHLKVRHEHVEIAPRLDEERL